MAYFSKAVIVWIDDHFLSSTFIKDQEKNAWHKLFGKINSSLYRLLDIKIKYIKTAKDAMEYITSDERFGSNTYYYFIVDRKLPYEEKDEAIDTNSEDLVKYLINYREKYNSLDFSILSSGSPESYSIKNIDYHLKPQNKEFTLPDELRHKILLSIKDNIFYIDQFSFISKKSINSYNTEKVSLDNESSFLYPFFGKYRSFVELEEINKKEFSTLLVVAPKSASDKFIIQSISISLFDYLSEYSGISYYKESGYSDLKLSPYYEAMNDLTDQVVAIRLDKWGVDSFVSLSNHLRYKHIKVFIIDSNDDELGNYIDMTKSVRISKVDTINRDNDISKTILFSLLRRYLNDLNFDLKESIYFSNSILFIHPLIYNLVLSSKVYTHNFDDPPEIIHEIQSYLSNLGLDSLGDADNIKQNILKSIPAIELDFVYKQVERLCGKSKYNELLFETLVYWLNNSWNTNYNVDMDSLDPRTKELWQEYSFGILTELANKLKIEDIRPSILKDDVKQIIKTIKYLQNNISKNSISTSKVLWPHEKFPMPSYIQNQLYKVSNKKLYVQDKDLSFIDDSVELENAFKSLEYKIEYYRSVFNLVRTSSRFMPLSISDFLIDISSRIHDNRHIFIDKDEKIILKDRDNFKKLANVLLRMVINFGRLVVDVDLSKVTYAPNVQKPNLEDTASLGKLLEEVREHIYSRSVFFKNIKTNLHCNSYVDTDEHLLFMQKVNKLTKRLPDNLFLNRQQENGRIQNKLYRISRNDNISTIDDSLSLSEYLKKIYINNNITMISQISNLGSYFTQNEHQLKVEKHIRAYGLLSYLVDTRNTWEHMNDKAWHSEIFIESFLYGYESIWLMHKFILEKIYNVKELPNTEYIGLQDIEVSSPKKKEFINNFGTFELYLDYYNKLFDIGKS